MADNEPKEAAEERTDEAEPAEAQEGLAEDSASKLFFGRSPEELLPGELETVPKGPTPMDSPSVQFFGKHLEEFVEQADDVVIEPAPRAPDESPSVQFFGEPLEETSGEEDDE